MSRNKKISRTRWTESEKRRLLEFRDSHAHWSWGEIKELFPGRSTTALCKQYSDLKIKRDEDAEKMANNDDEETEEMANDDHEATEEMTNNQNEVTNTTQLSKERKRLLDLGDNETPPRKQPKTGDVAANNDDDSLYSPSEDSESEGGDIDHGGDIGRSPTARQLRSKSRNQLHDIVVRSASSLKRPSKGTKLKFTAQCEARDSFSTTLASPDSRTVQKVKNSTKTTKTASASSHPTLSGSHSPEKATATNRSNVSFETASPVQETRPSLSPAADSHSAQEQQPTTNGHSPSKPEQQMAPPPPTPLPGATTASLEAGGYGYPPMQHGALLLMQAAVAMRDFPRERARVAQLEEVNENLMIELQKLKEKEAEWKLKIGELKISNRNLEGDLKKQADQVKKLEAELKEMSEKNNHGALNSANGATNIDCEHCLEHIGRLNALTKENEKMKQKYKLVAEAIAAGNDQA